MTTIRMVERGTTMENQFPIQQFLDPQGNWISENHQELLTEERTKEFYQHMTLIRTFDRKAISLQRQGRIGTYAPFEGQEASQVGSALALNKKDWIFPTYRDHGATMTFGHSLRNTTPSCGWCCFCRKKKRHKKSGDYVFWRRSNI